MSLPTRSDAIELLRKVGCGQNIIEHCIGVTALALEIAEACRKQGVQVNVKLVEIGALLHDIGRSTTHSVEHGVIGGLIVRELQLPEEIARIVERHVGGGITVEEAVKLGLPAKDYTPTTLEEKIVCYADKLIDGDKRVDLEDTIQKFSMELGKKHPSIDRLRALQTEIVEMTDHRFQHGSKED
jgi:uncharacterized protein